MVAWSLGAVALSLLVLAAHFLRPGNLPAALVCVSFVALIGIRRPWSRLLLQAALGLGTLVWIATLLARVAERQAAGEGWLRLAAILGGVLLLTAGSALLLETRRLRAHFGSPR